MKTNLKNNKQRSKLIHLGKESFYTLYREKKLPLEIIEKIVCELENQDLKSLISCIEDLKDNSPSTNISTVETSLVFRKEKTF